MVSTDTTRKAKLNNHIMDFFDVHPEPDKKTWEKFIAAIMLEEGYSPKIIIKTCYVFEELGLLEYVGPLVAEEDEYAQIRVIFKRTKMKRPSLQGSHLTVKKKSKTPMMDAVASKNI